MTMTQVQEVVPAPQHGEDIEHIVPAEGEPNDDKTLCGLTIAGMNYLPGLQPHAGYVPCPLCATIEQERSL